MTVRSDIWHHWIGVSLAVPAVLIVVGILIGYLYKVVLPRVPRETE
jgi:hypothetical protein